MEELKESPLSSQTEVSEFLTFGEAMKVVLGGGKVTKEEWGDEEVYGLLDQEILKLHKEDGKLYNWIVRDVDLMGNDWVEL